MSDSAPSTSKILFTATLLDYKGDRDAGSGECDSFVLSGKVIEGQSLVGVLYKLETVQYI